MIIFGAGLSGLLAGVLFPGSQLFEADPEPTQHHKAVLRFRTPDVGNALGIDFRPVTVHKGIWHDGEFRAPNIQLANFYSSKVVNKIADRSIWNLDPVTRYIAPEDLYQQLIERLNDRITWGYTVNSDFLKASVFLNTCGDGAISTIPLSAMLKILGISPPTPPLKYAPITVKRYRIDDCDSFQTIYFPAINTPVYRASITGNLLIVESIDAFDELDEREVFEAFGIADDQIGPLIDQLGSSKQSFGKIAPAPEDWRRAMLRQISTEHNIYSLGRFACWRNILLDDVLKDIYVIKRLMKSDSYSRAKHLES